MYSENTHRRSDNKSQNSHLRRGPISIVKNRAAVAQFGRIKKSENRPGALSRLFFSEKGRQDHLFAG